RPGVVVEGLRGGHVATVVTRFTAHLAGHQWKPEHAQRGGRRGCAERLVAHLSGPDRSRALERGLGRPRESADRCRGRWGDRGATRCLWASAAARYALRQVPAARLARELPFPARSPSC